MKKSLAHLPQLKQDELKLIVNKIDELVNPEKIFLFGSYARGDWKDGPHTQGDGEMTIPQKIRLRYTHRNRRWIYRL